MMNGRTAIEKTAAAPTASVCNPENQGNPLARLPAKIGETDLLGLDDGRGLGLGDGGGRGERGQRKCGDERGDEVFMDVSFVIRDRP